MKTILLTGFEPFDREAINPSWEAVRALDGWQLDGYTVAARQMPCVFGSALEALREELKVLQPCLVLAVGQAGGRSDVTVERVAINVDDARIADNSGQQPIDAAIVADGPAAYFSSLPIKAIVQDLRAAGLPASVSQTAGTFVCNHLFYGLMHAIEGSVARGGFLHIPYLPEQAAHHPGAPSMALAELIRALQIAIRTSIATRTDIVQGGGATH